MHPGVPTGEDNLVWQAALKFGEATGREVGRHFNLRKRIPVAAGLGGGSSDAAGRAPGPERVWRESPCRRRASVSWPAGWGPTCLFFSAGSPRWAGASARN